MVCATREAKASMGRDREESLAESNLREFTNEELSDVIRLAARQQTRRPQTKLSYEEMLVVGRELGIEDASLRAAAAEIFKDRGARRKRLRHKMGFMRHLAVYGIVITGLACINLLTDGSTLWFLFPAIGWGIGVAIQGATVYFAEKEAMLRESA
jgi:hypothetical protein